MYNRDLFPSLVDKAAAAKLEEWKGWADSPAHSALYETSIPHDECVASLTSINMAEGVAKFVASVTTTEATEGDGKGLFLNIFQSHNPKLKHGEASRIRYDVATSTSGFSQQRFDDWWDKLDKNNDGKMGGSETIQMLSSLTVDEADVSAPDSAAWIKKNGVFTLLYHGLDGDAQGGVDRSVMELIWQGAWKDNFTKQFPLTPLLLACFGNLLRGAA